MNFRPLLWFLLSLIILSAIPPAMGDIPGLSPVKIPEGSTQCAYSVVEGTVENWGYYRIFVAFPPGWNVSSLEGSSYSATSYILRRKAEDLRQAYGPWGRDTLLDSGIVFLEERPVYTPWDILNNRFGWWLRPNEGMRFTVTVNMTGSGVVDPFYLEREDPNIVVRRWNQHFYCEIKDPGYVKFPWVVKNATLAYSNPAPFAYLEDRGRRIYYYDTFEKDPPIPRGGRWFEFRNPLTEALAPDSLAPLKLEFYPIEKTVTRVPYLMAQKTGPMNYRYEWERYGLLKSQVLGIFYPPVIPSYVEQVPEWFGWFPWRYQTETRRPSSSE
ncbi:MAG: hypothetical protein HY555_02750 [Euryarchaeota archaeon]|nr:hypothetical protein [Euryarchaeota archaeon]